MRCWPAFPIFRASEAIPKTGFSGNRFSTRLRLYRTTSARRWFSSIFSASSKDLRIPMRPRPRRSAAWMYARFRTASKGGGARDPVLEALHRLQRRAMRRPVREPHRRCAAAPARADRAEGRGVDQSDGHFFDPATALCLNGKSDRGAPAMAQCRPDRCPNSCITPSSAGLGAGG